MATYQVETPDGAKYRIEADSEDQLNAAVTDLTSTANTASAAKNMAFERSDQYPNAKMTDPTLNDAMTVQGIAGLSKLGAGLAARGIGAALESVPLTKNIVPAIGETADSMLLKSIGTSPGQIKGLMANKSLAAGEEAVRDAAQVGRKAGLDDLLSTGKGRRDAFTDFISQEGEKIGGLRNEAGTASPDLLNNVAADVSPKYNAVKPDVFSSEASDVPLAQNTVENIAGQASPTNADISKGITGLNKYAAGNRVNLPKNALTDFAEKASAANDAEIAQSLGSDKAADYLDALHNESGAFHLEPAMARGFQREMTSRGGKGFIMSGLQKVADAGGYRAASKGLNAIQGALTDIGPVDNIINTLKNSPQTLGKYAPALQQAYQDGGNQGLAAMHYILGTTRPDYNQLTNVDNQ